MYHASFVICPKKQYIGFLFYENIKVNYFATVSPVDIYKYHDDDTLSSLKIWKDDINILK